MNPQKCGNLVFGHSARGNAHGNLVQRSRTGLDGNSIEFQKHQRSHGSRPFVAIEERMVSHDVIQVRCCHFERKGV